MFSIDTLLQMDRSPQGPAESVSAVWISIGNHSPTCFLKVSAHQQQKLCGYSELRLKGCWLLGHIQQQSG